MSGKSKFSWNDADKQELKNAIARYNRKLTKLKKENPYIEDFLPEKLTLTKIKTRVASTRDITRETKSAKRFLEADAEKLITSKTGLVLTQFEIDEARRKVATINQRRKREREKLDNASYTGTMKMMQSFSLRNKKFSTNKSAKDWEKYIESIDKQIRTDYFEGRKTDYRDNYAKAFESMGADGQEIADRVRNINPDKFYDMALASPFLQISFRYDPIEQGLKVKAVNDTLDALLYG